MLTDMPILVSALKFHPTFIGFEETSSYRSVFLSPSIGKPRITLVSFGKTTESSVSLVTIHRQTSYDSGILHQDYGIIRVTICVVHRHGPKYRNFMERTETDLITA